MDAEGSSVLSDGWDKTLNRVEEQLFWRLADLCDTTSVETLEEYDIFLE